MSVCVCLPGNGYIEEKELESFFKELEMSWKGANAVSLEHRNAHTHTHARKHTHAHTADPSGFTTILLSF